MAGLLTLALNPAAWAAVGVAFLAGFFAAFGAMPNVDIPAIVRNAEAGRDAMWQRKLIEANEAHEQKLTEAVEAAKAVAAVPADMPSRLRVCGADNNCRDKNRR